VYKLHHFLWKRSVEVFKKLHIVMGSMALHMQDAREQLSALRDEKLGGDTLELQVGQSSETHPKVKGILTTINWKGGGFMPACRVGRSFSIKRSI
jgi:CHAD domain-containing protein